MDEMQDAVLDKVTQRSLIVKMTSEQILKEESWLSSSLDVGIPG